MRASDNVAVRKALVNRIDLRLQAHQTAVLTPLRAEYGAEH